ncbi:hypothetical protein FB45DRAFT_419052 [Roridomyces roridus]|uniref:Uncharacterized protein n=1 Tax=Roridomyces roridus TaxID=1738132 RepID=A0AAD7FU22_9AGAR|nr:hypothetical protein FB45DRAFT_419052 [Roridomyces roridus]
MYPELILDDGLICACEDVLDDADSDDLALYSDESPWSDLTHDPERSSPSCAVPAVPEISQVVPGCSVFARLRGGRLKRLPLADERFDDILGAQGVPLVYKPLAVDAFAHVLGQRQPLVLRRPAAFGLRTFVSGLATRIDVDFHPRKDPFLLFNHLNLSEWSGHGLHGYYVLDLDFGSLRGSDLRVELFNYVHAECTYFLHHYGLDLELPSMSEVAGDADLLLRVLQMRIDETPKPLPVYIFIRQFDHPLYTFPNSFEKLKSFLKGLEYIAWCGHIGGLLLYSCIRVAVTCPSDPVIWDVTDRSRQICHAGYPAPLPLVSLPN